MDFHQPPQCYLESDLKFSDLFPLACDAIDLQLGNAFSSSKWEKKAIILKLSNLFSTLVGECC